MDVTTVGIANLPPDQQAIRDKCFHPSGTFVEFPKEDIEQSIPARFEKIVGKYPDRIAVKAGSGVQTYADLNAMANRLAHTLVNERGANAEPVAILFDNDAPLMAAMLGILKAGKFFVLLDPSFPRARIAAALEDSRAGLVVSDRQNVSLAKEAASSHYQVMEFERIDCAVSNTDLRLPISSTALAFIAYTSGSTGRPKGVVQKHRNILYDTMLRTNAYRICEMDRLSLLASSSSSALKNAFLASLNGASLLPFDVKKEGVSRLVNWLLQERISICRISAPLFRKLSESPAGKERFPDLRLVQFGGDTRYKADIELWKKYFSPNSILSSSFSIAETGYLTDYLIDAQSDIAGQEIPLGFPVQNKEILLLDDSGRKVSLNEIGEIVVHSSYLSAGYWGRPDLTEEKFTPGPHGGDKELYFTGDLGQMRPDGCLLYKGRKDFRVKIRGYGVEIAEVEKVLREHSAVKDSVVVARKNHLGESRLVAYLASLSQPRPRISDLRSYMNEQLPEYMIPSAFIFLESMPLTANGKIDRRALPDPGNTRPELDSPCIAPRTPIEHQLAEIWTKVLCLDRVGIHDNFFDLGGDSLAATRVVSQIIKKFQLEMPLHSLFQVPTVAEMAAVLEEQQVKKLERNDVDRILAELEALSEENAQRALSTITQKEAS